LSTTMPKFNYFFSKTANLVSSGKLLETTWGRLKWVTFLFCFVFLTTYPKYLELLLDPHPIETFAYFFEKIKASFTPVQLLEDTHGSKIAFRLVPPLLAKLMGIGQGSGRNIVLLYILQSLLLFPFLLLLTNLFRRFTSNKAAMLLTLSFSAIYVSKAFFWDYDFWFDGYAYFFLLLGMSQIRGGGSYITFAFFGLLDRRKGRGCPGFGLSISPVARNQFQPQV